MRAANELIDYRELGGNGEKLEQMVRKLGERLGLRVSWSGRGADRGRDLLFTETHTGLLCAPDNTWVVSCKDFSTSGESVRERDLGGSILDKVRQHKADGFLLVTTTTIATAAKALLDDLDVSSGGPIRTKVFDSADLDRLLLDKENHELMQQFLPESYKRVQELGSGRRFDIAASEVLDLATCTQQGPMTIDLRPQGRMDLSILDFLIAAARWSKDARVQVRVLVPPDSGLHRVLQLSRLDEYFDIVTDSREWNGLENALTGQGLREDITEPTLRSKFILRLTNECVGVGRDNLNEFVRDLPFTENGKMDLVLAVSEALSNAVRHSTPTDFADRIVMECSASSDQLVIQIRNPYRSLDTLPPELSSERPPPDPESLSGGLGVFLIKAVADDLSFSFMDGEITTRIAKYYDASSQEHPSG